MMVTLLKSRTKSKKCPEILMSLQPKASKNRPGLEPFCSKGTHVVVDLLQVDVKAYKEVGNALFIQGSFYILNCPQLGRKSIFKLYLKKGVLSQEAILLRYVCYSSAPIITLHTFKVKPD